MDIQEPDYMYLEGDVTVFTYQHIDDPEMFNNAKEYFHVEADENPEFLLKVEKAFKENGWEGDGELGVVWIPPFFASSKLLGNSYGAIIWHVKQRHGGMSFIGVYPEDLDYISKNSLLAAQNSGYFEDEK